MVTVGDLMRECRNYFETGYIDGEFEISGGKLSPVDGIAAGQYIAIQGSRFSDGVYTCDASGALDNGDEDAEITNETFFGRVWLLYPPKRFVDMAAFASDVESRNPAGGVQSESFGAYSYTKAAGKNGGALTWQEALATSLRPYRRLLTHVGV